jgi:hypothetical protein
MIQGDPAIEISDEVGETDVSKPNYFGKEYIRVKLVWRCS